MRDLTDLHITIATTPSRGITLERDMKLVKAALLYGDRATLCSLASTMILTVLAVGSLTPKERMSFWRGVLVQLIPDPGGAARISSLLDTYEQIVRKKRLSRDELLLRHRLDKILETAWTDLMETLRRLADDAGAEGIVQVLESGMLELHGFDMSKDTVVLADEFVEAVAGAISDRSTYPLFDESVSNLVSSGIREGKIAVSDTAIARGRHAALAANLFERLPLFDLASVEEILDIRRELERPLIRFRAAMLRFSADIEVAYWDDDFRVEADRIFHRDIVPSILEIEEEVKSNRYLSQLLRKVLSEPLAVAGGSALGLALSRFSSLPAITSQLIGLGLASAKISLDAYERWKERSKETEKNCLFFYYRTLDKLS